MQVNRKFTFFSPNRKEKGHPGDQKRTPTQNLRLRARLKAHHKTQKEDWWPWDGTKEATQKDDTAKTSKLTRSTHSDHRVFKNVERVWSSHLGGIGLGVSYKINKKLKVKKREKTRGDTWRLCPPREERKGKLTKQDDEEEDRERPREGKNARP